MENIVDWAVRTFTYDQLEKGVEHARIQKDFICMTIFNKAMQVQREMVADLMAISDSMD